MARVLALAAAWCASCAAPEVPPPGSALAASARCPLRIEFEPALLAPGQLHYAHECGEHGDVATGCASVELALPGGPVVLTLQADGRRHETVLRIPAEHGLLVWRLGN